MKLKIAIVYNSPPKLCEEVKKYPDIYFPIIAGEAVNHLRSDLPNIQYDNVGDNISFLNPYFNETTALYWIGTHLKELGNPDYIGLHHYRRIFDLEKDVLPFLNPNVMILNHERLALNMVDFLDLCHDSGQTFAQTAKKLFRVDISFIDQCVKDFCNDKWYFSRNLFVIPVSIMPILIDFTRQAILEMAPHANYSAYGYIPARHSAFIMERLTGLFFYVLMRTSSLTVHSVMFRYVNPEENNE